jgi:hypothetical protein
VATVRGLKQGHVGPFEDAAIKPSWRAVEGQTRGSFGRNNPHFVSFLTSLAVFETATPSELVGAFGRFEARPDLVQNTQKFAFFTMAEGFWGFQVRLFENPDLNSGLG